MTSRMPHFPSPLELAHDLKQPVRDILRGVRRAMAGPVRLLETAGAILPEPVQTIMHDIGATVDLGARGASQAGHPAKAGDVAAAMTPSVFSGEGDAASRFARVAYFGLSFVLRRMGRTDLCVSETVAGLSFRSGLAQCPPDAPASRKAATIAIGMVRHHAIGIAPSTALGLDARDMADSRVAVCAVMLWLLVERPEAEPDEAELLELCYYLATSQAADILQAGDDVGRVAALLETFSRMI